jgi:pimeloyl-ACP methyl ester carboxylesterase
MSEASEPSSKHHPALGWVFRFFLALVVAVLGVVALVYFSQHSMLYHPRPYDAHYAKLLPADGVELPFTTVAGKQVAYYLPRGLGTDLPKRIWVAFCGNGSLALDWTGLIARDRRAGDAFLLLDYPGYGKSEGHATIASTRSVADGALETLAKHLGTTKEKLEPLLSVLGHSWGTAVALDFAARHSIQRVVLIAVFTNLREEAALVVGGPLSHLLSENYDNRKCLEGYPAARLRPASTFFMAQRTTSFRCGWAVNWRTLFPLSSASIRLKTAIT